MSSLLQSNQMGEQARGRRRTHTHLAECRIGQRNFSAGDGGGGFGWTWDTRDLLAIAEGSAKGDKRCAGEHAAKRISMSEHSRSKLSLAEEVVRRDAEC